MRLIIISIFLVFLGGCTAPTADTHPRDTVHPIVLTVTSNTDETAQKDMGAGSAVVIAPGYALTAYHILRKGEELDAYSSIMSNQLSLVINEKRIPVLPVKVDKQADIALVHGDFSCPCASLYQHQLQRDMKVISVSYPLFHIYGVQILTEGHFQGVKERHFVTTAEAAAGSSGGGIFVRAAGGKHYLVSITKGIGVAPGEVQAVQHHWIVFSTLTTDIFNIIKDTDAERGVRY